MQMKGGAKTRCIQGDKVIGNNLYRAEQRKQRIVQNFNATQLIKNKKRNISLLGPSIIKVQ